MRPPFPSEEVLATRPTGRYYYCVAVTWSRNPGPLRVFVCPEEACNKKVGLDSIQCGRCPDDANWWHRKCAVLSTKEINQYCNTKAQWCCKSCDQATAGDGPSDNRSYRRWSSRSREDTRRHSGPNGGDSWRSLTSRHGSRANNSKPSSPTDQN